MTDAFTAAKVRNRMLVTGDWHSTFVNDILADFDVPDSPVVAEWRTDLRMVPTVSRADAPVTTFASFVVEDGHPGADRL